MRECPTCGSELELIRADFSSGLMTSAWYCEACNDAFTPDEGPLEPEPYYKHDRHDI